MVKPPLCPENRNHYDDGGASACLEKAEEEGEEQQLGLFRLDDLLQVLGGRSLEAAMCPLSNRLTSERRRSAPLAVDPEVLRYRFPPHGPTSASARRA